MRLEIIFGIFALLLLGGFSHFASAQTYDEADHVVINEVEINPGGSSFVPGSEWVELYNPTNEEQFIGNWQIASTTVLQKKLTLPLGTTINPGQHLLFPGPQAWFTNVGERIELRSLDGTVIDGTPAISDTTGNSDTWQLKFDGIVSNSIDDWKFVKSTTAFTNGKQIIQVEEESVTTTVTTDKEHYNFFDIAIISGSVSKQVYTKVPSFFEQQSVEMIISGPSYYNVVTLFPDWDLNFVTTLKLQNALGHNEGPYNVSITYDTATANTQFTLGRVTVEAETVREGVLVIATDKPSYLPGETMLFSGETSKLLQFEGLNFEVKNADRIRIAQGNLFPSDNQVNSAIRGGDLARQTIPDAQFTTHVFIDNISPIYGTYQITAQYGENQFAETTFEVIEDVKEDTIISLSTDKQVYAPGDLVVISGRLNGFFQPSLTLNVDQTEKTALHDQEKTFGPGVSSTNLKIQSGVRLEGDGRFTYEFTIPNNANSLGEFRITVWENVGRAVIFFKVVESPETFVPREVERLSISTDKTIYEIGERMQIIGRIGQLQESSVFLNPQVDILIVDETGQRTTIDVDRRSISGNKPTTADLFYTGVPDAAGNFIVTETISRNLFQAKDYRIVARYADGKFFDSTNFRVVDPFDIGKRFELQLNKEVFGLGETVFLDGIVPGVAQHDGVKIKVYRPDGTDFESGSVLDNSRFSWSWVTPMTEKTINVINERSATSFKSNFGVYQLVVAGKSGSENIFFKVSPNPDEDTLDIPPLEVTTDKAVYNAGETLTVIGVAMPRPQGSEGLVVPDRASISIKLADFPYTPLQSGFGNVFLDIGGNFQIQFPLPLTVVEEGKYRVTAIYGDLRDDTFFFVDNDFVIDPNTPLVLLLNTDKQEYGLGETVHVTATPSKFVILKKISMTVIHEDQFQVTCGSFICGLPGATSSIVPDASGTFTYEFTIPSKNVPSGVGIFTNERSGAAIDDFTGVYEVVADAQFGTFSKSFLVTERATIEKELEEQLEKGKRTTEKVNRIPGTITTISIAEKTLDGEVLLPRVLQGSLLTVTRGEENNVNIKVTTEDGNCIIGQESGCMVSDSTRAPGTIYQVVEIDGKNYNVRYSGPDARLEKFTILPSSSIETLPDSTWTVEVMKDEQPSRLFYKITYVTLE